MRRLRTTPMASCCPARRAVYGTRFCSRHLERTLTVAISTGQTPATCLHCGARPPGWRMGTDYSCCLYCGAEWTRHIEVTG